MSLRRQVLRGGTFLAVRQGLGMLIGLAGVLTLTKVIGPANYGRYAAAVGLMLYLQAFATLGLNVFLVRRGDGPEDTAAKQVFTLLLGSGLVCATVLGLGLGWLESVTRLDGLGRETRLMALLLPLILTAQVPLAELERALRYRTVAAIELCGQLTYYAVALPLALQGRESSAPFLGWAAQQTMMAASQFAFSRFRPSLVWDRSRIGGIVSYGLSYSASNWVWQLRTLVNPVIVGRFAGLEAVGVVALAIRLTEYLTFVKATAWRLSLAALGRMQNDLARIRRAIEDGMFLQLLAVGPVLVLFSLFAPSVVPRVFGEEWSPALVVFPFIASSYLMNAVFNLHSSALYALQHNWSVSMFHIAHVALFGMAAAVLVPQLGVIGYGIAELVALASYLVVAHSVRVHIGSLVSGGALVWSSAFTLALFSGFLGKFALSGLLVLAVLPATRQHITSVARQLQEALRGG